MKDFFSKDGSRSDVVIGSLAIACVVLAMLPFMPGELSMLLTGTFIALFALFSVLIWKERPRDEREAQLVLASDRLGFLAGAVVLSLIVVIQTVRHQDTRLYVIVLVTMIIAKLIGKYLHK